MSNVLEWLSGARLSNELGHRFEQWGIPSVWASNMGTALAPTVLPHHFTSYYAARERGMDPTDARQFATSDALRTAAAAAAVYGGVEAAGAYGAGGAASGGGGASSYPLLDSSGDVIASGNSADAASIGGGGGSSYGKLIQQLGKNVGQGQQQRQSPSDSGMAALVAALMAQQNKPQQGVPLVS